MSVDSSFVQRKSIRLKEYDYALSGAYFITICVWNQRPLFGRILNEEMHLNEYGFAAVEEWQKIPQRFEQIELGAFVIMPNHIHGIIIIQDTVGTERNVTQITEDEKTRTDLSRKTLSHVIGAYKSLVVKTCLQICKANGKTMDRLWQRSFYEHIIRNDNSYHKISQYIIDNPMKWELDKLYSGDF